MTRRNAQLYRTRAWPAMASHDAHLAMPPASVPPPLPQGLSVRERPPPGDMHTCCTVHSANRLDRVLGIALLVIQHACRTEKMKRPGPGTIVTVSPPAWKPSTAAHAGSPTTASPCLYSPNGNTPAPFSPRHDSYALSNMRRQHCTRWCCHASHHAHRQHLSTHTHRKCAHGTQDTYRIRTPPLSQTSGPPLLTAAPKPTAHECH